MKVVILHHHMNPGGVTRVIQSQIESLQLLPAVKKILLISGAPPGELSGVEIVTKPAFNYLQNSSDPGATLESILNILKGQLKKEDILHVHNPNLGKNPVLTLALYRLAESGHNLLYHIHDFAEDRPANMEFMDSVIRGHFGMEPRTIMYPTTENVRYATLSSADQERLVRAGLPRQKIALLPNPIQPPQKPDYTVEELRSGIVRTLGLDAEKLIVTYPVRVIQRKNIGEFLLLSILHRESAHWLVTQPPLNPVEIDRYKKWVDFSKNQNVPVVFEAGQKVHFDEVMFASDFCATTSIREGFGMVYLEPWMYDTPVVGRNLRQVTSDFEKEGVVFPGLYDRLLVPSGKEPIDFCDLAEEKQREVIANTIKDSGIAQAIFSLNPNLKSMLNGCDENLIKQNKRVIENRYSLERYGHELAEIYQAFSR